MSRCHEWNSALSGMYTLMDRMGIESKNNRTTQWDNIINKYCKKNKIKGSFSERILLINQDFPKFRAHLKSLTPSTPTNE